MCIAADINAVSAEEDADTLIIEQAIKYLQNNDITVVVGTDTDLLVLLVAQAPETDGKLFFLETFAFRISGYSLFC